MPSYRKMFQRRFNGQSVDTKTDYSVDWKSRQQLRRRNEFLRADPEAMARHQLKCALKRAGKSKRTVSMPVIKAGREFSAS